MIKFHFLLFTSSFRTPPSLFHWEKSQLILDFDPGPRVSGLCSNFRLGKTLRNFDARPASRRCTLQLTFPRILPSLDLSQTLKTAPWLGAAKIKSMWPLVLKLNIGTVLVSVPLHCEILRCSWDEGPLCRRPRLVEEPWSNELRKNAFECLCDQINMMPPFWQIPIIRIWSQLRDFLQKIWTR